METNSINSVWANRIWTSATRMDEHAPFCCIKNREIKNVDTWSNFKISTSKKIT